MSALQGVIWVVAQRESHQRPGDNSLATSQDAMWLLEPKVTQLARLMPWNKGVTQESGTSLPAPLITSVGQETAPRYDGPVLERARRVEFVDSEPASCTTPRQAKVCE